MDLPLTDSANAIATPCHNHQDNFMSQSSGQAKERHWHRRLGDLIFHVDLKNWMIDYFPVSYQGRNRPCNRLPFPS